MKPYVLIAIFCLSTVFARAKYRGCLRVVGRLVCNTNPAKQGNITISMYDSDWLSRNDLMAVGTTDENGFYQITGCAADFWPMKPDPYFTFDHECPVACQLCPQRNQTVHTFKQKIDKRYLTHGVHVNATILEDIFLAENAELDALRKFTLPSIKEKGHWARGNAWPWDDLPPVSPELSSFVWTLIRKFGMWALLLFTSLFVAVGSVDPHRPYYPRCLNLVGRFVCRTDPEKHANITVYLYDYDWGLTDDYVSENQTDQYGRFALRGCASDGFLFFRPDPYIVVHHDCPKKHDYLRQGHTFRRFISKSYLVDYRKLHYEAHLHPYYLDEYDKVPVVIIPSHVLDKSRPIWGYPEPEVQADTADPYHVPDYYPPANMDPKYERESRIRMIDNHKRWLKKQAERLANEDWD
ncbi:unnamed protein product, partial [Mesorhabditis spiculigera]